MYSPRSTTRYLECIWNAEARQGRTTRRNTVRCRTWRAAARLAGYGRSRGHDMMADRAYRGFRPFDWRLNSCHWAVKSAMDASMEDCE